MPAWIGVRSWTHRRGQCWPQRLRTMASRLLSGPLVPSWLVQPSSSLGQLQYTNNMYANVFIM